VAFPEVANEDTTISSLAAMAANSASALHNGAYGQHINASHAVTTKIELESLVYCTASQQYLKTCPAPVSDDSDRNAKRFLVKLSVGGGFAFLMICMVSLFLCCWLRLERTYAKMVDEHDNEDIAHMNAEHGAEDEEDVNADLLLE
jgi:hypothetical protein